MVMVVSVGVGCRENCVLMSDRKPSTIEMTQTDDQVVVGCSGQSYPLMLNHGLKVSRFAIGGMRMEIKVNVEQGLQLHSVLPLESSLRNIEMIRIVDLVGAGCHGSCLSLMIHPTG